MDQTEQYSWYHAQLKKKKKKINDNYFIMYHELFKSSN